jgi:hypothetical protein
LCKYRLRRILGNVSLTYEEFSKVLVQIEAVLNSRPMYCLSSDPVDYLLLPPSHFFISRPLTATAVTDVSNDPINQLTRYNRVEQLRQNIWKRWSLEYVTELLTRTKWKVNKGNHKLNSLVLLKNDYQQPPLK